MIRLIQRRLIIPRGDTGSFSLPVISSLNIGDVAVFTIFDTLHRTKIYQKVIEPSGDKLVIRFEHEDTVNLPIGKYFWDIKFYQEPVFYDGELVDGKEVDSYYAAFNVPDCEIRQTGDNLLNADDAPNTTLTPESINFVESAINEINQIKSEAHDEAVAAANSATESAGYAADSSGFAHDSDLSAEASAASAQDSANEALKSEGHAVGQQNGVDVGSTSPYYENNSKYYSEQSAASAVESAGYASESSDYASNASGYADAASGYANTASGYADNASASAVTAAGEAQAALGYKEAASRSAGQAANSEYNAYLYSESANTDASNAYNYKVEAGQSATLAGQKADAASQSASAAHDSEVAAAASEATALGYVNQIKGLSATATQLGPNDNPTASYNTSTGVLTLGIPEGVGITSIVLNQDYTLTINLNNGQSVTTTSIRGPQGPQGDAFHIVKTYASITAMNADYSGTDVKIGEFVMIVSTVDDPDNAKVYVKGDQQYNFVVDMSGAAGIEGPEGKGINSVSITYQGSASNTSAPTGTWVDNPPSVAAGEYLWTRIIFTYTDSTTSAPFYSVAKQGDTGLRGSTWYNGTAITGTNTTPQIFVNSNITDAVVGDMYLNTETSNTYCCTLAGGATVAKWAYVNNIKGGQGNPGPVGSEYTVLVQESQPTETSNKLWIPNGNNGITQEVPTVSEMNAALAGKANTSDIKVQDVQVNGTSVISGGVANVPQGSGTLRGVFMLARNEEIKEGISTARVLAPGWQHAGAFYGLAKAAGDTTQSQSDNAVGTYTDAAKAAIRTMVGAVGSEDYATSSTGGVVKINTSYGIGMVQNALSVDQATVNMIKIGTDGFHAITPARQERSAFYGLAKAAGDTTQSQSSNTVGTYTDNAKASIKSMLGIIDGSTGTVDVTGTTPTITAVENTRYVCGEVATLDITPPASGICIVRFTSGTTATVLTATGVVWPEWFDDTALEASRVYEICITDGYGAVMSWAL